MASDFDNIRSNLRASEPEKSPNQLGFILALVGVVVIGGAVGFLMLPNGDGSAKQAATGSTSPKQAAVKTLSKGELKQMRREELQKYRETHTMLMSCARSQRHMATVYQTYQARNADRREAWFKVLNPTDKLSKMADMNQLEASAYMLTQGRSDVRDIMQDISSELGSAGAQIDSIKCGQLNAQVQRRELDLKPVPTS